MFKNKKLLIGVLVVVLIALVGGGYFFFAAKSKPVEDTSSVDDVVQKLSPEEIGLDISASPDKKKVKFSIAKLNGIKSVEYEVTYEADSTAQEQSEGGEARVQRGITGEAKIDSGKSSFESDWLDLGSCSKNVCRYDTGVKSVKLTLKIVKDDGKTYSSEKSLDL